MRMAWFPVHFALEREASAIDDTVQYSAAHTVPQTRVNMLSPYSPSYDKMALRILENKYIKVLHNLKKYQLTASKPAVELAELHVCRSTHSRPRNSLRGWIHYDTCNAHRPVLLERYLRVHTLPVKVLQVLSFSQSHKFKVLCSRLFCADMMPKLPSCLNKFLFPLVAGKRILRWTIQALFYLRIILVRHTCSAA